MTILSQLNSPVMYLICGSIIAFVAAVCVFFAVRAWKAGLAIGMDKTKGSLETGKDADIIITDCQFNIKKTIIGGEVKYES